MGIDKKDIRKEEEGFGCSNDSGFDTEEIDELNGAMVVTDGTDNYDKNDGVIDSEKNFIFVRKGRFLLERGIFLLEGKVKYITIQT